MEELGAKQTKSKERFFRLVSEKKPEFEIVGDYTGSKTPVEIKHKKCGRSFMVRPDAFLAQKNGCPFCSPRGHHNTKERLLELEQSGSFHILGTNQNKTESLLLECEVCGHEFRRSRWELLGGKTDCPFCKRRDKVVSSVQKKNTAQQEKAVQRLQQLEHIEPVGEYHNFQTPILFRCKAYGHEFKRSPMSISKGFVECPICKKEGKRQLSGAKIEARIWGKGGATLKEYVGYDKKNTFVCEKCGTEYQTTITSFMATTGNACPHCTVWSSAGEDEVAEWLMSLGEKVITHDRSVLHGKEIDIYLPERKLGIEFDGLYYHSENALKMRGVLRANSYHAEKTKQAFENGVRLIHIYEDEWRDERAIVEDKLKAVLGVEERRIFARKCLLVLPDKEAVKAFLDENHIQGRSGSGIDVGLEYEGRLVAVQSFIAYTRSKDSREGDYELVRYATSKGMAVIGGFSKCLKWFERKHLCARIISFADLRWCDQERNVYLKNGFVEDGRVPPDYEYVYQGKRYHKFLFRKRAFKSKFPEVWGSDKTESEMAKDAGLERIYDCGKIRYIKKLARE